MKQSITSLFVLILAVFSSTMVRSQEVSHSVPLQKSWLLKASKYPAQANAVTLPVRAGQLVQVQLSASYHNPSLLRSLPIALSAAVLTSQIGKTNHHPELKTTQAQSLTWPLLSASAVLAPAVIKSLRGAPKAYAQLRLYDQQGTLLSQQTQSITKEAKQGQLLAFQLPVQQEGFAQLQLVNESKQEVRFEQVSVSTDANKTDDNSAARRDVSTGSSPVGDQASSASAGIPPIVRPGGTGTATNPWILEAAPVRSVVGYVDSNWYIKRFPGLYQVIKAGVYNGYYFQAGYYFDYMPPQPPPTTVTGGGGTTNNPYILPEFVVHGNVPTSKFIDLGGGLFSIQAGTYANPNPGGSTPKTSSYPGGIYQIIDPEKQAQLYKNPCEGYKAMWNQSFKNGTAYKEVSAWITDKGLLVLPMGNNTNKTSQSGPFEMDLHTKQYSVTLNGIEYKISGYIHTHPNTGVNPATGMTWQEPPSSEDYTLLQDYGIPTYTIGTNNIYKSTLTNGRKTYDTLTSKTNLLNCSYQIGK